MKDLNKTNSDPSIRTDKDSSLKKKDQSPGSPNCDKNSRVLNIAGNHLTDLADRIRRTSSFNKLSRLLSNQDFQKHKDWKTEFEKEFTQFFLNLNFKMTTSALDSKMSEKMESAKSVYRKIIDRMKERSDLEQNEKPCETLETSTLSNKLSSKLNKLPEPPQVPESIPGFDMNESPPFEYESDTFQQRRDYGSKKSSMSEIEYIGESSDEPTSPILSRNNSFSSQQSKTFQFKKPGAGINSSDCYSNLSATTSNSFRFPEELKYPNNSGAYFESSSGIQNKQTGTQFIEDFSTQEANPFEDDDLLDEGEINYNKQLYKTQSSISPYKSSPKKGNGAKTNFDGKFIGEARNDGKDPLLSKENHSFSPGLRKVLTEKFGMRDYRPNQLQAINSAVMNKDTFVLMPTGGGKSLCYQLPAAFQGGITVVVSPLISLIQDQVTKLNGINISADHLSGDDYARQSKIYTQMRGKVAGPTLLYVTPEKITSSNQLLDALTSVYNQGKLQRFVIDEAHCVSQWGHDFRPDYKKLSLLRTKFPNVPMMALTATATPRVRTDILFQLKMKDPKWFLSSFNRSNLKYEVRQKKGKSVIKEISDVILANFKKQSGIVYCLSKRDCDQTATALVQAGIKAAPYHAGLDTVLRNRTQDDWIQDKIRVVCATIAFGMGIDKPDVRYVLHQSLPKSIEGYYQESGRAGRDGEASKCILFYHYADMHRLRKLIDMGEGDSNAKKTHYENLWQMVRYAENVSDCRRVLQLQYFGEVFDHNRCGEIANMKCDNCTRNAHSTIEKVDITEVAKQIIIAVQRLSSRPQYRNFTINQFVDIWRGMKNQKVVSCKWDNDLIYGKGKSYSTMEANRILKLLVIEGYLWENMIISRDGVATAYLVPGNKCQQLISGQATVLHQMESKSVAGSGGQNAGDMEPLADPRLAALQEEAMDELKHLVLETGKQLHPEKQFKGVNEIIPLQALRMISEKLPLDNEALGKIEYMTAYRLSLYGDVILSTCKEFSDQRMDYLASQAQANQIAREEDEFLPGGADGGNFTSKSRGRGGGRGRRGGWKKGGTKRKSSGGKGGGTGKRQKNSNWKLRQRRGQRNRKLQRRR